MAKFRITADYPMSPYKIGQEVELLTDKELQKAAKNADRWSCIDDQQMVSVETAQQMSHLFTEIKNLYAVGTPNSNKGHEFTYGPNPDLKDVLTFLPTDKNHKWYIIELTQSKRLYVYDFIIEEWISVEPKSSYNGR